MSRSYKYTDQTRVAAYAMSATDGYARRYIVH